MRQSTLSLPRATQFWLLNLPSVPYSPLPENTRMDTLNFPRASQLSSRNPPKVPHSTLNSRAAKSNVGYLHPSEIPVSHSEDHRVQTGTIPRSTFQRNILTETIMMDDFSDSKSVAGRDGSAVNAQFKRNSPRYRARYNNSLNPEVVFPSVERVAE